MPDPLYSSQPSAAADAPAPSSNPDYPQAERQVSEDLDASRYDTRYERAGVADYEPVWIAPPRRNRPWLNWFLFAITVITTTLVGVDHWRGFKVEFGYALDPMLDPTVSGLSLLLNGFWYGATIMAILGAHELGHYFACRYYRVDASPPYFIPLIPFIGLTGTLGAFIRIRQPITSKRVLFDIAVAGPVAGFMLAVPALFIGIAWSTVDRVPVQFSGLELGEPLLFQVASWILWGPIPDTHSLNLHPMAFAAWFGLLATVLNLFPIGQLDGGHLAYAVLGRRSAIVTRVMVGAVIALTLVSWSWVMWAVLLVVMLFVFGAHHPPTLDESVPLDRTRLVLIAVAFAIFVLCFTPAPIQPLDLIQ